MIVFSAINLASSTNGTRYIVLGTLNANQSGGNGENQRRSTFAWTAQQLGEAFPDGRTAWVLNAPAWLKQAISARRRGEYLDENWMRCTRRTRYAS